MLKGGFQGDVADLGRYYQRPGLGGIDHGDPTASENLAKSFGVEFLDVCNILVAQQVTFTYAGPFPLGFRIARRRWDDECLNMNSFVFRQIRSGPQICQLNFGVWNPDEAVAQCLRGI